jgi:hypothetical protein
VGQLPQWAPQGRSVADRARKIRYRLVNQSGVTLRDEGYESKIKPDRALTAIESAASEIEFASCDFAATVPRFGPRKPTLWVVAAELWAVLGRCEPE